MENDLTAALVADDTFGRGLAAALERRGVRLVATAPTVDALLPTRRGRVPGVVLVAPRPGASPEREVAAMVGRTPKTAVIVLADPLDEIEFLSVLAAGAVGYLPATLPPARLAAAVAATFDGEAAIPRRLASVLIAELGRAIGPVVLPVADDVEVRLSAREWEVVRLLRQGLSTKDVAAAMFISPATVRTHVAAIVAKLGATDRAHALRLLYERGA